MKKFFFLLFIMGGIAGLPSVILAQSATLSLVPAAGTVQTGQLVTVTVMVNTGGAQVNAVGVYFTYPANLLEGIALDTTGSALDTFTPEKTVAGGRVVFAAAKQPPPLLGFQKLFSATFRAKSSLGSAQLAFTSDSAVLTHGESKNILNLAGSGSAVFQIVAPPPGVPTPPPAPTPQPTPSPTPLTPAELAISDIRAKKLSEESVLLSWKTSEATKAQVNYGPSSRQDHAFSVLDGAVVTEHSLVLSDVSFLEDYSLEIIGMDARGNQVKAESLVLAELLEEESEPTSPEPAGGEIAIGGFEIRPSMLFIFVLLPILVILLAGFLMFRRIRAQREG
ncbi:MAG: cohesin domain-containing protein [Patescibacteria group bacterium]